jgi:tRNA-specific 2-thiouridylase
METPNPDVYCNRFVKFAHFRKFVQEKLQITHFATGHYATTKEESLPDGRKDVKLYSGVDPRKDQSYFLSLTPVRTLQQFLCFFDLTIRF